MRDPIKTDDISESGLDGSPRSTTSRSAASPPPLGRGADVCTVFQPRKHGAFNVCSSNSTRLWSAGLSGSRFPLPSLRLYWMRRQTLNCQPCVSSYVSAKTTIPSQNYTPIRFRTLASTAYRSLSWTTLTIST